MSTMVHRHRAHVFCLALAAVIILAAAASVASEPITRLSAIEGQPHPKQFWSLAEFRLGGQYEFGNEAAYESGGAGGVTLESIEQQPLQLAYIAVGKPQRDKEGKIINAVVISTYYSGDSTNLYDFWHVGQPGNNTLGCPVVGPGQLIDTDKFYVVFLDAVGLWGTSKPSQGLGMKFPKYVVLDYAQANYRLLRDHLGIAKVKLATGVSMGGMQTYALAVLHPDFVEAIMPIGGASAMDPVTRWLFTLSTAAMQSDPVWRETRGEYYDRPKSCHPNRGMMFGWSILGHTALDFDFRAKQSWEQVKKEVFAWELGRDEGEILKQRAADYDVNDLLYRNFAGDGFDLNGQLHRIKAKTLIVHVKNDQWLRYVMAEETAKKISGSRLVGFTHDRAHYAVFRAPMEVASDIEAFFKEIGMK